LNQIIYKFNKLNFDALELSNNIFEANNKSFIKISNDYLKLLSKQYTNHLKKTVGSKSLYLEKSSHLANAEWLLFNSIYIALVAQFEYHLLTIAEYVEKRNTSKIKISDLKGNGITLFLKYFDLVADLKIVDKKNNDWQKLNHFIETRNRIVHSGGILKSTSKNLETEHLFKFLIKHGVKVTGRGNSGQIRIRELTFLKLFSDFSITLSKKIIREINQKLKDS
jgi:hypothetical protein